MFLKKQAQHAIPWLANVRIRMQIQIISFPKTDTI